MGAEAPPAADLRRRRRGRHRPGKNEPLKAGFSTAETITVKCHVADGMLDLQFMRRSENPKISAIQIKQIKSQKKRVNS